MAKLKEIAQFYCRSNNSIDNQRLSDAIHLVIECAYWSTYIYVIRMNIVLNTGFSSANEPLNFGAIHKLNRP